ncbi:MAG: general secretion pathway protein, partial [Rubrivivax sp.]
EPPRVYALNELPPNIRQQLPQLSVGGAMYSESPSSRMLILNGQPFKEGDQPTAHLKLEQINLKSAVLSYKGYRYAINY